MLDQRNRFSRSPFSRTRILVFVALVAAALLVLVLPSLASAKTYSAQELGFLQLINQYRQTSGLGTLLLSDAVSDASTKHSSDMAKYNFFDHTTVNSDYFPVGSTPWDRMRLCGYGYNTSMGENIAAGQSTAQAVFDSWRSSPGHNANMLNAIYRVIGIGLVTGGSYGAYWTTDFGGYVDPTAHDPGPLPSPTLTITAPTGTGSYTAGANLMVNWTSSQALSSGEFGVWARSASLTYYISKLVPASGGTSFSTGLGLNVPAGTGYQVIVGYRPTAGSGAWTAFATSPGSFSMTGVGPPTLTITAPTGTGSYTAGANLMVNWTSSQALSSGEFGVWARSASLTYYISKLVPASGGTSFSTGLGLNVPAGTGYQVIVGYRPTAGSGAWTAFATSPGSFSMTGVGPPTLTITAPTGTGSYTAGANLMVNWTSSQALSSGEFGVWARSASLTYYISKLVPASGGTSFSTGLGLNVPAGTGYQVIVGYRPTAGSGAWTAFATSPGSFSVTSGG